MTFLLIVALLQPVGPPTDCLTSHKLLIGDLARCSGLLVPSAEAVASTKTCDARVATAMAIADDRTATCKTMLGIWGAAKAARDTLLEDARTTAALAAVDAAAPDPSFGWLTAAITLLTGATGGFLLGRWIYK